MKELLQFVLNEVEIEKEELECLIEEFNEKCNSIFYKLDCFSKSLKTKIEEMDKKEIHLKAQSSLNAELKLEELLIREEFDDYIQVDSLRENEDNVEHDTNELIY